MVDDDNGLFGLKLHLNHT